MWPRNAKRCTIHRGTLRSESTGLLSLLSSMPWSGLISVLSSVCAQMLLGGQLTKEFASNFQDKTNDGYNLWTTLPKCPTANTGFISSVGHLRCLWLQVRTSMWQHYVTIDLESESRCWPLIVTIDTLCRDTQLWWLQTVNQEEEYYSIVCGLLIIQ